MPLSRGGPLKKDQAWSYCLQFLRLSLVLDEKKAEVYRQNTREYMRDTLAAFVSKFESVSGGPSGGRHRPEGSVSCARAGSLPAVPVCRQFQEGNYATKVLSLMVDVVADQSQYAKLDGRRPLVLSNGPLAREAACFLTANPSLFPDRRLSPGSRPVVGAVCGRGRLTAHLFRLYAGLEPAIAPSSRAGPLSSADRRALARASAKRLETQESLQLVELFLLSPSAPRRSGSARLLDSLGLPLRRPSAMDSRFVWAVVLVDRYGAGEAREARRRPERPRLEVKKARNGACVRAGRTRRSRAHSRRQTTRNRAFLRRLTLPRAPVAAGRSAIRGAGGSFVKGRSERTHDRK
jgi:hypothetical protein